MPIDPKTGAPMPYAGEPGAPADAPPMPAGGEGESITGQDLMDRAGQIDQILSEEEMGALDEAEAAINAPMPGEGGGDMDMTPLAEALGVDPARASEIYEAAQQMPQLAGLPIEELAALLAQDFDMRMRVEALAAGASDTAAGEMAEAEMMGDEMPSVPA